MTEEELSVRLRAVEYKLDEINDRIDTLVERIFALELLIEEDPSDDDIPW